MFSAIAFAVNHGLAGRAAEPRRADCQLACELYTCLSAAAGTAGGAALTAAVLAIAAYVEGTVGALATQPASAELAFRLVIGLPLLVGGSLAALLVGRLVRAAHPGVAAP